MIAVLTPEVTVGALVAERPSRARVFEAHRIDYCCAGKLPLSDACTRRQVDVHQVIREIEALDASDSTGPTETNWLEAPLGDLVHNIKHTHHAWLRTELPRIAELAAKVAGVHGQAHPEVVEIHEIYKPFHAELKEHMMKEESILFPWINVLERAGSRSDVPPASVMHPIRCMELEHENAGDALGRFRALSNDYTPPMDACNTWRVLYASLAGLEADMHIHVHKENSILFPRALKLEERLA